MKWESTRTIQSVVSHPLIHLNSANGQPAQTFGDYIFSREKWNLNFYFIVLWLSLNFPLFFSLHRSAAQTASYLHVSDEWGAPGPFDPIPLIPRINGCPAQQKPSIKLLGRMLFN